MPKRCDTGLTKNERGYSRTVGYYMHNGKRVPRKFRLGHDRALAKRMVEALETAWEGLPGERGQKVWTEDAIQAALNPLTASVALVTTVKSLAPVAPVAVPVFAPEPVPPPSPVRTYTLPEALDEFTKYFDARFDISQTHRDGTKSRINSVKLHIDELFVEQHDGARVYLKDLPVSAVDMEWMGKIRNKITSRPLTKHVYDTPKPISIDCVKNWLMALAMAFDWLDRTPRIGWVAPHPRWRENFTLTKKQEYALRTPDERDNEGKPKPAYTVDELVQIYMNTSPLGKKYLLMGLLLGWSQEAIKSFRKCHLLMIDGEYYIDRRRGKTGIEGFWWLCPELAEILKTSIANTPANADHLAFLTEDGLPLVHGKTDTIRLTWERALNTAPTGTRKLPFGAVKKCGAQIIENLGGHELAQLFLAHRPATVAAGHYTGSDVSVGIGKTPFQRLHGVQKLMYEALRPLCSRGARLPVRSL
jgi:hypothetical protein